ncbi:MAG: hypothetical protein JWR22_3642 [Herminiimonas sp.]|nr:hypothetical protein [Herminiimonas sp.]
MRSKDSAGNTGRKMRRRLNTSVAVRYVTISDNERVFS